MTLALEANDYYKALGDRIRQIRKNQGFSQAQLAFEADVARNLLIDIEKGKANFTSSTLIKLCKALEVEPLEIFTVDVRLIP